MDSLTQIVLGAAVGEMLLGRQLGNKALLLGAIGGTIPDLDVIYTFFNSDPIRQLEVHRSYSHSMFTHVVLAWPLALLSLRWSKIAISKGRWYLFWFLALFTHALLDCCTTYGTQFFLPFTNYQVAFNNINVIDPLYTLPFMFVLLGCMFYKRNQPIRRKFLWVSITVSSTYMLFTFCLKYSVHEKFKASLKKENIQITELNSSPTILNAILWSGIAYNDSMLYVSEYSFLKSEQPIVWVGYKRNLNLLATFDCPSLKTITWFSDGNYFMQPLQGDTVAFYNVKWGRMQFDRSKPEEAFFFYWKFYVDGHEIRYKEIRNDEWKFNEALRLLLNRIGI
jgi:inner membrane protein